MKTNEIKMIKKNKGTSLEFIAKDGKISFVPVIDNLRTKFFCEAVEISGIPDGQYRFIDSKTITKNAEMIDWNSISYEASESGRIQGYLEINKQKFGFETMSYFMDLLESEEIFEFSDYDISVNFTSEQSKLLNKLVKGCSCDNIHYFMNGIYLDKENFVVSTDRRQLYFTEYDTSEAVKNLPFDFILNRSIVPYMKGDCRIDLFTKTKKNDKKETIEPSKWAILHTENNIYAFPMIIGNFPKWRRVVPENASVLSDRIIPEFKPCELDFKELKNLKAYAVDFTKEKTEAVFNQYGDMRSPLKSRLPIPEGKLCRISVDLIKSFPYVFENPVSIWSEWDYDDDTCHSRTLVFVESPNVYDYELKNKIRALIMPMQA